MDAFGFIALLLLAVPIILVAVLGMVLVVASRRSRVAGLAILTIVGGLLVALALLVWVRCRGDVHYAEGYDEVRTVAPAIESEEWISVEEGIVPVAAVDEGGPAASAPDTDAGGDEAGRQPAEDVKAPTGEVAAATVDAVASESDTAEADSGPNSQSPVKAISSALVRALGNSSPPTDDTSEDTERDAAASPDRSTVESTKSDDIAAMAVSTPVATDSNGVAADYRPIDPDRADMAEIKRYLDEAGSRAGVVSDVDSLSPGTILPPEPPPWVNMATFSIDRVHYLPVASGPYATRDECRRALAEAMKRAVDEYIDEQQGHPGAADHIDFDLAYIKSHLRHSDVYQERVQASFGPMIQQHVLLEFGQEFREEIRRRWKQVKVTTRLAHVSLAAVAILAGLATIFVYLRVDTATKGYYSGRLQIAAGAVILGLVALGVLTARWIPWL